MTHQIRCEDCGGYTGDMESSQQPRSDRLCPACKDNRRLPDDLANALGKARRGQRWIVAVMSAERDAIHVTQQSTSGVNLAIGCGALAKSILGRLDPTAERKFLEEFVKELRS